MKRRQRFIPTLAAVVIAATMGCTTSRELGLDKVVGKPAPPNDPPTAQQSAPERDERSHDDNLLAMLAEKTRRVQELEERVATMTRDLESAEKRAKAAQDSEESLAADVNRLEKLLQDAVAREQDLKQKLVRSRLEAVRAQQELIRMRIRDASEVGGGPKQ